MSGPGLEVRGRVVDPRNSRYRDGDNLGVGRAHECFSLIYSPDPWGALVWPRFVAINQVRDANTKRFLPVGGMLCRSMPQSEVVPGSALGDRNTFLSAIETRLRGGILVRAERLSLLCIANVIASIISVILEIRETYEQKNAPLRHDAVGCILQPGSGGELTCRFFRRTRTDRFRDAVCG